jgi:hypothetical protein
METNMKSLHIALIAHAVNAAYSLSLGDTSHKPWDEAPESQKESSIAGVEYLLANPEAGPEACHESWMAKKLEEGWTLGEVKDEDAKTHPCLIPFEELPEEQQAKDYIFHAVVHAVAGLKGEYVTVEEAGQRVKDAVAEVAAVASKIDTVKAESPQPAEGQQAAVGLTVQVEYIGPRENYRDPLYETGIWVKGQKKNVPVPTAMNMLRHPDVFKQAAKVDVPTTPVETVQVPQQPKEDGKRSEEERMQDFRDQVSRMDLDQVKQFVKTNFNGKTLHHNIGLEKARVEAVKLIDQFGIA